MSLRLPRANGFTLVELMIVMSVTAIMTMVVMNFMADNLVASTVENARADLLHEEQSALDLATYDIRLSAAADDNNRWQDNYAPGAPGNLYSWSSNSSTLILATAAQDIHNNILFADANNYITNKDNYIYFVKNGTLYKRILPAPVANNSALQTCPKASATSSCPPDKELLHNVTTFTVKYYDGQNNQVTPSDARSIELTVALQTKKYGHVISANYTTRTVFRND